MEKKHPIRPIHTGSARVQAQRAQQGKRHTAPTHLITARAAVAVEKEPQEDTRPRLIRWAHKPLDLGQGRWAVSLRQEEAGPIEVGVRGRDGILSWRLAHKTLDQALLRAWVREGFGGPPRRQT